MNFTSLYIHIPFCLHRCGYCDFNTYAGLEDLIPDYSQAVCEELEYIFRSSSTPLHIGTIYFGGGTPSLLPTESIATILGKVKENYSVSPAVEITLEANPGTVSSAYLDQLCQVGVNRISFGMQSANPGELALLDRQHSIEDVSNAVQWGRAAGIDNLNLDLIFGLPGQDTKFWMTSVEAALALQPEHLSLYALTLEHGTPLQHRVEAGLLPMPDEDLAADMYEAARAKLPEAGFRHYEISNWARTNENMQEFTCQHNLQYWRSLPYLGVGAGAHGFINHYRTVNVSAPAAYIERMRQPPTFNRVYEEYPATPATIELNPINIDTEMGELMMMGLRLVEEGVSNLDFQQRYGSTLQDKFHLQIEHLVSAGLLEWSGAPYERLRITTRGQLLGNQVFREFI